MLYYVIKIYCTFFFFNSSFPRENLFSTEMTCYNFHRNVHSTKLDEHSAQQSYSFFDNHWYIALNRDRIVFPCCY